MGNFDFLHIVQSVFVSAKMSSFVTCRQYTKKPSFSETGCKTCILLEAILNISKFAQKKTLVKWGTLIFQIKRKIRQSYKSKDVITYLLHWGI